MPNHSGFSFPVAQLHVFRLLLEHERLSEMSSLERERDVFSWVVRGTNVDICVPFPLCAASTGRLSFPLSPALASYSSSCALLSLFLKAGIPKCKKLPQSGSLNNLGVHWQVFLRYGFKTHNTRNENLLQYISGLLYNLQSWHNIKATTILIVRYILCLLLSSGSKAIKCLSQRSLTISARFSTKLQRKSYKQQERM